MKRRLIRTQSASFIFTGGLGFLGLFSSGVQGAEISGPQSGRWNLAGSPYVVTGNIVVPENASLTIEPGVVVKFAGYYSFKVDGVLRALGTPSQRIIFTSANDNEFADAGKTVSIAPTKNDWSGIEFSSGASQLENCVIRFCTNPLRGGQAVPEIRNIAILECNYEFAEFGSQRVILQNSAAPPVSAAAKTPVPADSQDETQSNEPSILKKIELNAFADMTFGLASGEFASANDKTKFEQFGAERFTKNSNEGFGIVGSDFVLTANLAENLIYQAEVNLQVERGRSDEVELDTERFYVDYGISDAVNIQAGLYFTPIGFMNRKFYARAWLMKSIQIHDFFEEELGFVPTHTVGVNFYGGLPAAGNLKLNYALSVGNGRGITPTTNTLNRDASGSGKEVAGMLEWVIPAFQDLRLGLSGATNKIKSYKVEALGGQVDVNDPNAAEIELRELVFNSYLVLHSKSVDALFEYTYVRHTDRLGNLGRQKFLTNTFTGELALNLAANKVHPYLRYDATRLPPDGGPYYGLQQDGEVITRFFIPEFKAVMAGIAYDVFTLNRIKIEYIHHWDGPRRKHGLVMQTAFGF